MASGCISFTDLRGFSNFHRTAPPLRNAGGYQNAGGLPMLPPVNENVGGSAISNSSVTCKTVQMKNLGSFVECTLREGRSIR